MDFSMFDFTVTPDVRRLAEKVEGLFQRDLSIHRHSPDSEAYRYIGGAWMSTLDVGISLGGGFGLYSLAHELCHLRRYAWGIPRLASDDETEEWTWRVEQPLEHLAIYPDLARMDVGIDPYANPRDWELFRQKFPERIERAAREKVWPSMHSSHLSCVPPLIRLTQAAPRIHDLLTSKPYDACSRYLPYGASYCLRSTSASRHFGSRTGSCNPPSLGVAESCAET